MAVYSPISKKELETLLKKYNIGNLVKFEGILEGIENTNYKIKTSKDTYILTIFEKRVKPKELPFFVNLKNHLSNKNFICPKPIKNKHGTYINLLNKKNCIIISFLKGKKTSKVKLKQCNQVGKMLALLHLESSDFLEKRYNSMDPNQWKKIFLKNRKANYTKFNDLMANIEKEISYLKILWPKNLPSGIIHADVFQDNVFFKNNEFSGLIDFYFACNDFFAYDLALTINAWCFDDNVKFKKKNFLNLIQGYESLRLLSKVEKEYLSILSRGAALRILLTRIHDSIFHMDGAYVKPKNPNEYLSILKFHQQNNLKKFL